MRRTLEVEAAKRQVELLTDDANAPIRARFISDRNRSASAQKVLGAISDIQLQIEDAQAKDLGAFFVVNGGGDIDDEITNVRALFVDADGVPLTSVKWHVPPDFIVQRDETHWHGYWVVRGLAVADFRNAQKRLANYYKTDPAVCNPSRVMRLAGSWHLKGEPVPVTLLDNTNGAEAWAIGHSADELLAALPELAVPSQAPSGASALAGKPLTPTQLSEMLSFLDPGCERGEWRDIAAALHATNCTDADFDKRDLFVRWSRGELSNAH